MKRKVIKKLTTTERLTLLEQIFAPQGEHSRVEFASCALSDMEFLFDFEDVNLVEMKWPRGVGVCGVRTRNQLGIKNFPINQ